MQLDGFKVYLLACLKTKNSLILIIVSACTLSDGTQTKQRLIRVCRDHSALPDDCTVEYDKTTKITTKVYRRYCTEYTCNNQSYHDPCAF